jgi:hypothetical protein
VYISTLDINNRSNSREYSESHDSSSVFAKLMESIMVLTNIPVFVVNVDVIWKIATTYSCTRFGNRLPGLV